MAKFLRLVAGVPRSFDESATVPIYDETLLVVDTTPGAGEIAGPITAGVDITLPDSQEYTSDELMVYLNGDRLVSVQDYNYIGSPPRTQVEFTFELVVGDVIRFRIDRSA